MQFGTGTAHILVREPLSESPGSPFQAGNMNHCNSCRQKSDTQADAPPEYHNPKEVATVK